MSTSTPRTSRTDDFPDAMLRDLRGLRNLRQAVHNARNRVEDRTRLQARLDQDYGRSKSRADERRRGIPAIQFVGDLPILQFRQQIVDGLRDHQVMIVSGETGSGKSTQLPKICLSAGFGVRGLIGHTQPRRIAARSVAARVAEELQTPLGEAVGFKVRFTDKTNPKTFIKLMTDGVLLAETQHDRALDAYEVLIIDEAHERSLNIDFLLGYVKRLLPQRPELRVIITSATIDAERFAEHFGQRGMPAPILKVSGRSYPVEVRYRPWDATADDESGTPQDELSALVAAVHELAEINEGHVLVFLPTERDIREAAKRLRGERSLRPGPTGTEILPLYARLSVAEQNRIFQPYAHRRIVLATNVAESSLTVPGIRYVIDTGTARISRYAPRSKVQRLPIESVSRASADQRKGRCGRVAPGICIRLYSEEDYAGRTEFTTPEIQRTNLASVILQAKVLKLGHLEAFPFLDPPRPESIRDGFGTLFEIGAVDSVRELTDMGRQLSRFPVDPRIARIILAANQEGCLHEMLIIASALELQDPRERPHDKRAAADEAHAKFLDPQSDFVSYLKIWDFYHDLREKLSRSKLQKACQQNFLSLTRLREWTEIHRQLLQLATDHKLICHTRQNPTDLDKLHRALLPGFLSGIAFRSGDFEYTGAGGLKFHLWPGSGLFQTRPQWCVVTEIVETAKRYGRTVARIDPAWIEQVAGHIVKRSYSDPHFHRKSGSVHAHERVTLYGMTVIAGRRVPYGPIDRDISRQIFIRDGLASRGLEIRDAFWTRNEEVLKSLEKMAARTRRAEYLTDALTLERFYDQRLPPEVYDLVSLRRWLKESPAEHSKLIALTPQDLLSVDTELCSPTEFPDSLQVDAMELPVEYHFAPGENRDGVTMTVPVDAVGHLSTGRLGWTVPGLVEDKIVALIRSLPKSLRRGVIPAPDVAKRVAAELKFGEGDFLQQVAARLSAIAGESIPATAFALESLPPHLQVNVRVVDVAGKVVDEDRDIDALRSRLGIDLAAPVQIVDDQRWQRSGLTKWDCGELPKQVDLERGSLHVPAYPTLIDQRDHVDLGLITSAAHSKRLMRAGVRRLYVLDQRKQLRSQVSWLPQWDTIRMYAAGRFDSDQLARQVTDLIADRAFLATDKHVPRSEAEFVARLTNSAERIGGATTDVAKLLPRLFRALHEANLAIEQTAITKWKSAVDDVKLQIDALCHADFLVTTPWNWLSEYPRYFQAICYRLERLASTGMERDRGATHDVGQFWSRYLEWQKTMETAGATNPELDVFRWMVEEYRVSLFAQPLGTAISVSPQKLEKQWQKVVQYTP